MASWTQAPSRTAPATISTVQLIQDCRKAAKEKKWDLALQLIEAALQGAGAETQPRNTILDTRVAVYLRMDKPDLALKDAKAMIRNDRTDGRGYIRCGQIEIGRGNATVAASFYEYGLKRVPTSSQHFETISTALSNVQEQIRIATMNSKPADPMQILPLEIVETILSYVPYRQHVRMLRVCRAWNKLLRGLRPLTDTLAFPKPSRGITSRMVHAALRRLKCPTAVYIKGLDESASKTLADRMQCWQNIQNLSILEVQDRAFTSWKLPLSKCGLTSVKFGPSVMTSILDVRDILRDCHNLGTAQFENVVSVGGGRMDDLVLEGGKLQHLVLVSAGSLWCNPVS
jgi:F-box/TPR repeat protein Pof3